MFLHSTVASIQITLATGLLCLDSSFESFVYIASNILPHSYISLVQRYNLARIKNTLDEKLEKARKEGF